MSVTSQSMPGVQGHHARYESAVSIMPLANAVTAVATALYLICAAVAALAPDLFMAFLRPWFHAMSLEPLRAEAWFSGPEFILGVITFGLTIWIFTAATASLYNWLARR